MPKLQMRVRRSTIGGGLPVTWLALDGFLDSSTVLAFEDTLELLHRDEKGDVALDMGHVPFANSTAIGTILNHRNLLFQERRELVLIRVAPQVLTTFGLLGLTAAVPCLPDEESAGRYFLSAPVGQRDPQPFIVRSPLTAEPGTDRPPIRSVETAGCNVLLIAPEENRFTDITKMRLLTPKGRFRIVTHCTEALHVFDDLDPDLVILEDPLPGSEDFLWEIKTEKGKSIVPIIKLYWKGTQIEPRRDFKIWEDDYLVEPFEVMELFVLAEAELKRIPEDRRVLLHQTHLEFRTRPENLERANELAATLFHKVGLASSARAALAAAFAEAIENAARHAHQNDPQNCIDVVFLLDREKLSVTVTDEGKGSGFRPYRVRVISYANEVSVATAQEPPPKTR